MRVKSEIIVVNTAGHLAKKGAEIFLHIAMKSIERQDSFSVALSGGSTPKLMYSILSQEPYISKFPWEETHIFWVDERCVPISDPESNYGKAKKDFLDQISIPTKQIYRMNGKVSPEEGAVIYEKKLRDFFKISEDEFPAFNLIFLGIGEDGHTASLFPGQKALEEKERLVVSVKGGNPNVDRLTMTFPVLNRAKQIVFLVSGKEKASIVKDIFENSHLQLPVMKIQPVNGKLTWLLDRDAAFLLSKGKVMS